ncbi:MAG: glycosyltransferase family 4 protein [Polynucleobacter sp.]|nr:glycosyltransferase family 4 protein [Polynucleobacter sp.]
MFLRKTDRRLRKCLILAPSGQVGGGMGRVKDYIISSNREFEGVAFEHVNTRDDRGVVFSVFLTLGALSRILRAAVSERSGTLIHANVGDRGSVLRKGALITFARILSLPVVLHLHSAELQRGYQSKSAIYKICARIAFAMSNMIIVLGDGTKAWLIKDLKIFPDNIVVLRNGVAVSVASKPLDVARGERVEVLFLGNLIPRKGVSELLAAVASLKEMPQRWKLTLAGGGEIERYQAEARLLGVEQLVQFTGWLGQAAASELVASADILVLPSFDEGLPLVILEALGSWTAVVCTPVGSIPEVLTDGENARFVPVGDSAHLSDVLKALINDREARERLAAAGRTLYEEKFSLSRFAQALAAIYRQVI